MNKTVIKKWAKRFRASAQPQTALLFVLMATGATALIGCKEHKPQPTCRETLKVVERNGQRVLESLNGIYLKEDFPVGGCAGRPFSEDHYQHHYVARGSENLYWYNGKLYTNKEVMAAKTAGKWAEETQHPAAPTYAFIDIGIAFAEADAPEPEPDPDWWYSPALQHKLYPIDLLPNFRLKQPDPQAGSGAIKDLDGVYWAIRGTKAPITGRPYMTSM